MAHNNGREGTRGPLLLVSVAHSADIWTSDIPQQFKGSIWFIMTHIILSLIAIIGSVITLYPPSLLLTRAVARGLKILWAGLLHAAFLEKKEIKLTSRFRV